MPHHPVFRDLFLRESGKAPIKVATLQGNGGLWFSYGGGEWDAYWNTSNTRLPQKEAEAFAESRVRLTHHAFKASEEVKQ